MEKAADILAGALRHEADLHEQGALRDTEARMEAVRREVSRCNDIPRPVYKLALRFWKAWALAASHDWQNYEPITKDDWPRMARTIAQSVHTGRLPNDPMIIRNFVRRRPRLAWRELKRLLGDQESS